MVEQARGVDRVAEHELRLGRPERPVRSERRHDVDALELAVEQPDELRDDLSGTRVQPRLVGRHEQHAPRAGGNNLGGEITDDVGQLGVRQPGVRSGDGQHVRRIGRVRPAPLRVERKRPLPPHPTSVARYGSIVSAACGVAACAVVTLVNDDDPLDAWTHTT